MNLSLSSYLDAVRFVAALLVYVGHLNFSHIDGPLPGNISLADFGNDAVMVFFVLSGFIIAYVRERKETSIQKYIPSRAARLFSIAWPALLITAAVDLLGKYLYPDFYTNAWWIKSDNAAFRIGANALLLNQIWFLEIRPLSNGPFWSLGYEAWFYVIFIPLAYARKHRIALTVLLLLIAGPRIAILFPIWLSGVLLYRMCQRTAPKPAISLALCFLPILAYGLLRSYYPEGEFTKSIQGDHAADLLTFLGRSANFIENYVVAALIWLHFFGAYKLLSRFDSKPSAITKVLRTSGSWTFALYATHYPIIHFIAAGSTEHRSLALWTIPIIAAIIVTKFGDALRPKIVHMILIIFKSKATKPPQAQSSGIQA